MELTSRRFGPIRIGLLVAVSQILAGRGHAACPGSTDFGQLTYGCGGGTAYCYVVSPGFNTPQSIATSFWSLRAGNSVVGTGTDNGSWAAAEAWLFASPFGAWLGGSWIDSAEIDGCINGQIPPGKPAEIMVASFSDADVFGAHAYFAVAAVARHPSHTPQFDFAGGVGSDIRLKPIPRTHIQLFSPISPGAWRAFVNSPSPAEVAGGVYSDGSTALNEAVVGYRVYKRQPSDGRPPTDRRRSTWTPVTGVVPSGQTATFDVTCAGPSTTYYANSLVFDSGFETGYVSANGPPVKLCLNCGDDLDADGWSYGEICGYDDCNDDDPSTYPGAPEVNDGEDNQCPDSPGYGAIDEISGQAGFYHPDDTTKLTWLEQDGASQYEVARSGVRDFSADCLSFSAPRPTFRDMDIPSAGGVFYYLIRATAPHAGSWGESSAELERAVVCASGLTLNR